MKFFKFLFFATIVATMFITSCGKGSADGEYSLSFEVPDSVAYEYGLMDAGKLGVQSLALDEFSKGMKETFNADEEDAELLDSAYAVVQRFSAIFNAEVSAKKEANPNYEPDPIDLAEDVSYSLGLIVGNSFKGSPFSEMNVNVYLEGLAAFFADKTSFDPNKSQRILNDYLVLADSLRSAVNEKYLADNKEKKGVITTPSGLQYEVLEEGSGDKPSPTSQVKVHYKGTFVDGKTFDSSYDRGEPITFPLNGVIAGWTEGVGLMSVGAKYEFTIPYQLGYGEQGNRAIPGKSTLVFEVELLEILPDAQPQLPSDLSEEEIKKMLKQAEEESGN